MTKTLAELRTSGVVTFPQPYDDAFVLDGPALPNGQSGALQIKGGTTAKPWGSFTGHADKYLPNAPGRTAWSMSMWHLRILSASGDHALIATKPGNPNNTRFWGIYMPVAGGGPTYFNIGNIDITTTFGANTWHFIVWKLVQVSGSTWAVYQSINGQAFVFKTNVTLPTYDAGVELHFAGMRTLAPVYYHWGTTDTQKLNIKKLMFWNFGLTDQNVQDLHTAMIEGGT